MGFLLMQYEYQRASREVSIHQRAGIRLNNQVTRYTKRVEKMQSLFEKAKSRLENNINTLQNNYSNLIQTASTAASQYNYATAESGFNGQLANIRIGGIPLSTYVAFEASQSAQGTDTKAKQQLLAELSTAAAAARSVLTTLMTELKEVETTNLENQQDEQLAPISEKESDLQAEKDLEDTLCQMWTQRRDNAKEQLSQDVQNGMAKYGLK